MAVFYLKYAKAQAVAQELETVLAGGSVDSGSTSDKGSTSRRLATGSIKITPETRLNALLVLANRTDRETISRLLTTLDLKESPEESAVAPKPRMIPVVYARAKDIAEELRQIYADRLVVATNQNQQGRGAGIAMMMRALGGGGGRGGGRGGGMGGPGGGMDGNGQNNRADQINRIAIGVDSHTNTIVVAAVDSLFEEVKQLVEELDAAEAEQHETVQVIPLHRTSAVAVERALVAFAGDAVQTTDTKALGNNGNNNQNSPFGVGRGLGRANGGQASVGGRPFGGGSNGGRFSGGGFNNNTGFNNGGRGNGGFGGGRGGGGRLGQ